MPTFSVMTSVVFWKFAIQLDYVALSCNVLMAAVYCFLHSQNSVAHYKSLFLFGTLALSDKLMPLVVIPLFTAALVKVINNLTITNLKNNLI